jgi:hypothetical protein
MIELQRTTVVQETRSAFQTAMQHKFIAAVERLSGREVLAFVSNHHVGPDMEIELFMLKPKPNQTANPLDDAAVPARGTQTTRSRGAVQCLMPVETPVRWEARANPQRRERMGSRAARRGLGVDIERHATGTRASTKPDRRHRFRIGLRMLAGIRVPGSAHGISAGRRRRTRGARCPLGARRRGGTRSRPQR